MKPLYGHGGAAVFKLAHKDFNFGSLYDMFSTTFREPWVVQEFLPQVMEGDKRIILVDGEPLGAVNRLPQGDDIRSNMVRGGRAVHIDLTPGEIEISSDSAGSIWRLRSGTPSSAVRRRDDPRERAVKIMPAR